MRWRDIPYILIILLFLAIIVFQHAAMRHVTEELRQQRILNYVMMRMSAKHNAASIERADIIAEEMQQLQWE